MPAKTEKTLNQKSLNPNLSPRQVVQRLDDHIVGQAGAKKAVAIAFCNRGRRKLVEPQSLREEIVPKNILVIGPTGVGKTEIARRLSKLVGAPFIKVEATRFTEVGYVGSDVEKIIRDLVEVAIKMVKDQMHKEVEAQARQNARDIILNALVGQGAKAETRQKFANQFDEGKLDNRQVEVEIPENSSSNMSGGFEVPGGHAHMINLSDMISKAMGSGKKLKKSKVKVADAFKILSEDEADNLLDEEAMVRKAIDLCENDAIVFIDEIDKICVRSSVKGGDVSREGVQRDLLPLVEGTAVSTKYGMINTDHILFIASGAFHLAKPSDLLPELQGRFPIRVQLDALKEADLFRILTEPQANLIIQYQALLKVEGVTLEFSKDGIKQIAKIAAQVNNEIENIGARRLHTLMEKILEEVSFEADSLRGKKIKINAKYVNDHLGSLVAKKADLAKFIL